MVVAAPIHPGGYAGNPLTTSRRAGHWGTSFKVRSCWGVDQHALHIKPGKRRDTPRVAMSGVKRHFQSSLRNAPLRFTLPRRKGAEQYWQVRNAYHMTSVRKPKWDRNSWRIETDRLALLQKTTFCNFPANTSK